MAIWAISLAFRLAGNGLACTENLVFWPINVAVELCPPVFE